MLRTADLEYELPEPCIATAPASPRDSARMMVVSRSDPALLEHRRVRDLPGLLRRGDLLVLNQTRVVPARFNGVRLDSGGRVQGLFLAEAGGNLPDPVSPTRRWLVLIKARRQSTGVRIGLLDHSGSQSGIVLELEQRDPGEPGAWIARIETEEGHASGFGMILERVGLTPLPPYILQARRHAGIVPDDEADRAAYQTVFARADEAAGGSVAAPTAGLHFTPDLLQRLEDAGIDTASVLLHVGTGTFKPVETDFVEQHTMHGEWCSVPRETGRAVAQARAREGRVVAVGTTSARALESFPTAAQLGAGGSLITHLLITPGFHWKHVDILLTNFHLPRSTLLALVGAFLGGNADGIERLKALYRVAIDEGYRFYSFGDAMLILP